MKFGALPYKYSERKLKNYTREYVSKKGIWKYGCRYWNFWYTKYPGPALIWEGGPVCFSRFHWQFLAQKGLGHKTVWWTLWDISAVYKAIFLWGPHFPGFWPLPSSPMSSIVLNLVTPPKNDITLSQISPYPYRIANHRNFHIFHFQKRIETIRRNMVMPHYHKLSPLSKHNYKMSMVLALSLSNKTFKDRCLQHIRWIKL